MKVSKQFLLSFLLTSIPLMSHAFSEMRRHGYAHCIACHVSPDGGGTLTEYGRGSSEEILNAWSSTGEAKPLYGLVPFSETFLSGGDLRSVQVYQDTSTARDAKFILMQADAEAAIRIAKFTVDGMLGYQDPSNEKPKGGIVSHRHYLMYQPSEHWSFRGGKFFKAFGINTPDHIIETKRGLGWDEGSETYNLEGAYLGENFDIFVTAIFGRPDRLDLKREKGISLRSSLFPGERYRAGLSYYYGENDLINRHVFGPFAVLAFTKSFYLLTEFDLQAASSNGNAAEWGLVDYARLNYEITQGTVLFLSQETARLNFKNALNQRNTFGLGIQFFPRPHFEFQAVWQKKQVKVMSEEYFDFAYLLLHFYL